MFMTTDELVVVTNVCVSVTSILVAAASEHDAVKAMSNTVIQIVRAIAAPIPPVKKNHTTEEKEEK